MIWLQTPTVFWLGGGAISLRYKLPCIDHIPKELTNAGGRTIHYEIHKLQNSVWNKEELLEGGRSLSLYLSIRRVVKEIVVIIEAYHSCELRTEFYPTSCSQGQLHMQKKLLVIMSVDFYATGQLLVIYSAFVQNV